jgi:hypothetical protein
MLIYGGNPFSKSPFEAPRRRLEDGPERESDWRMEKIVYNEAFDH